MPTIVSTLPSPRDLPRKCLHCGVTYQPSNIEQMYCTPRHSEAAKKRRRKSEEPPPVYTVTCGWTDHAFESTNPNQQYCSDNHRVQARNCRKKDRYLSAEAADAAARRWTQPGLTGKMASYRCPNGNDHWHLFSVDKQEARVRERQGAI